MYLDSESDRIRTILSGTPLSAEKLRMSGNALGTEWYGTAWYFFQHIIAKEFTRSQNIPFQAIHEVAANYGVSLWTDPDHLRGKLETMVKVFNRRGLGNIEVQDDGSLKIGGLLSKPEFRNYASTQYEHAMGDGLVAYNSYYEAFEQRSMSNYAERILWHYITQVYDRPRVYDSPEGENALAALHRDIIETMKKRDIVAHGINVWDDLSEHIYPLLVGWERSLVSKNILKLFEIGGITFVAPAFYADIDGRVLGSAGKFSAEKHEALLDLVEKLRKLPAYPVMKGTEKYQMAIGLQRAGAIKIIEDAKTLGGGPYAYLVSRDVFESFDKSMNYPYSVQPFVEYGDSSVTDLFFKSLGRARLYAEQILPEVRAFKIDFKNKIDKVINDLEQKGTASIPAELDSKIFSPLVSVGAFTISDGSIRVQDKYEIFVSNFAEYWSQLINDSSLLDIRFPTEETIRKKEASQTENQIKKNLAKML